MSSSAISRRTLVKSGGTLLAGLSVLRVAGPAHAFPAAQDADVLPWLDQPEPNPVPEVIVRQLAWEQLDSWITPNDEFFVIKHFTQPELDERDWRLEISGLVAQPMSLTLADLKARARQEVTFTLECSATAASPSSPVASVPRPAPAALRGVQVGRACFDPVPDKARNPG